MTAARTLFRNLLYTACAFLLMAYSAWAKAPVPEGEFSNDFFWRILGGVGVLFMAYATWSQNRRDKAQDERDALVQTIAKTVYGDGSANNKGLVADMSVVQSEISRCPGCSPGAHPNMRAGDTEPHFHLRAADKDPSAALKEAVDTLKKLLYQAENTPPSDKDQ